MKTSLLIVLCRISLVFVLLVGLCICFWWYPFSISLTTIGLVSGESSSSIPVDQSQYVAFWTQLVFVWLTSLPCFAVLFLLYRSTIYAKSGSFFSHKNANTFKIISLILLVDSVIYIVGNIVFMFLKLNPFAIVYYVIGTLGIIIALSSFFTHLYLEKATRLKEDNDSIL